MQQIKNSNYPSNALIRFWIKVPLVIRAIIIGFIVSTLGVGIWVLLATKVPAPWSIIAMCIFLILYWIYFSGRGKPESTKAFRRFHIRRNGKDFGKD